MKKIDWEAANALCDKLSPDQDLLVREMSVLAQAGVPLRFSRVMEAVEGISQKSLTKTLRQLEKAGLVTRVVFAEVPPRVEYRVTGLGKELLMQLHPVWLWTVANVKRFQTARSKYAGAGRTNHWTKPRVPH
jgi:DNA-binding HxlR family transcriptional regulator